MTEVAGLLNIPDHRVATVCHYEAGPPVGLELVEPGDTFATTKEEEWVSKKTTEVTNTKQIETRVKRQVVLEDGKVVDDTGPMVTTNTTEDSETQEHHQTELRKLGDENDPKKAIEGAKEDVDRSKWVAVPNPDGVVREVKERRVVSREETDEVKETEDVQHLGDITDEDFLAAVRTGRQDLRQVLRTKEAGQTVVATGPKLVHESSRSNKVTDTEETRELSSVRPDGRIVTETQRTTEHEEVKDDELPENAPETNLHRESKERYFKVRDQEDVEYLADGVKIGQEMRYRAETTEAERRGDGIDEPDWDSLSARARRSRQNARAPPKLKGISDWSERRRDVYSNGHLSPPPPVIRNTPSPIDIREEQQKSSYINNTRHLRVSPPREFRNNYSYTTPTPPQRKKVQERRQRVSQESTRYDSGYRTPSRNELRDEPLEEPPPDYSPPSPPREVTSNKKQQKTRFAADPPPTKAKSGNIIGQSIRKLVGKIRSASAERKARLQQQRAKRSPSPSYQKGHVIDNNIQGNNSMENGARRSGSPVHRYYLGEDPFGGSIYGRENKYDGVRPARSSRRHQYIIADNEEQRSHSTLGRFSKSTGRLVSKPDVQRSSQTLPRHSSRFEPPTRLEKSDRANSTINVSIINTVSTPNKPLVNGGPAKPARTYRSNLARSKSFNVDLDAPRSGMFKSSNSNLHRLDEMPIGLKSPGLISSINRSQRDLTSDRVDEGMNQSTSRFARNGVSDQSDSKRVFLKELRQRAPELYKTLHESEDDWKPPMAYSTPIKTTHYNGDIYEPPTRLRETQTTLAESFAPSTARAVIRRGSNSSTDFSETYHTTTRNDDPLRPSITDTVKSYSKKTVPSKDGRSLETIESTEKKSVTKSRLRGEPTKYSDYQFHNAGKTGPVVIEVRNNYRK